VHSTAGDGSHVSRRTEALGADQEGKETHREYVDGCPHADFKKLVLARLGVPFVISPRKLHREAQRMGDLDGAISASTRRVK
jgi:hypothetical protein